MTRADREDQRVRRASLTRAGLHERKELDRRSNELALSILDALSARQRDRLMTAMGEVERLLQARPANWLRSTQVSSTKTSGIKMDRASCAWTRCRPPVAR